MTVSQEQALTLEATIFVIILLLYILSSHIIEAKKVPYLHESTVAIFMGVLLAVFTKYGLHKEIQFSGDLFFTIILPPIIFSAGFSLRKSLFFENFAVTGFLGIIGTIIGFICMSGVIIFINQHIFKALTVKQCLLISSVLCATDTVAAMALIKPQKFPVLNAVLFGEGIINDAVAIILFRTIQGLDIEENGFTFKIILQMAFDFTYLFFFSVAFGCLSGLGLSFLFKKVDSFSKYPLKETSLILLNGYFTYLVGQLLGLSGIITLFTCAIVMGHYCFMNISLQSQRGTGLAFQTVSYIAEAFVFAYLGASVIAIEGKWGAVLMAAMILLFMPLIRAIMVYILPLVYLILRKKFPMNQKQLKVCWYSGMVRGVIAFALCLQIDSSDKKYIITVALVIVMLTTIIGSTFLKNFMNFIGLKAMTQEQNRMIFSDQQQLNELNRLSQRKPSFHSQASNIIKNTDNLDPEDPHFKSEDNAAMADKFNKFQQKFINPYFKKNKNQGTLNYQLQTYKQPKSQIPPAQETKN